MPSAASTRASDVELGHMKSILEKLADFKDEKGLNIAEVFMQVVSRRDLPDYYQIIKKPIALSNVLNKIKQKRYTGFEDFKEDTARVFHNAKIYNRQSSQIYQDAVKLEGVLSEELKLLVQEGVITDATLPDLGPLPTTDSEGDESGEDNSEKTSGDDEEEEDEDEEMVDADAAKDDDDDDMADDIDDLNARRRSSRRVTKKVEKSEKSDESDGDEEKAKDSGAYDANKKRGRPPRVDNPNECRIKAILKGVRKFKDDDGNPRHAEFEKLPDPKMYPEYYRTVSKPVAIDTIKKRVKRREYKSVEAFMDDVNTMFNNAMAHTTGDTAIYKDATFLREEARKLAEIEMAKDDSEYMDETSKTFMNRIPVPFVDHKGERYKVGDWVHIHNANEGEKPTVGQIFRTWKTPQGKYMIAVCWYYRPEQTVHRVNKRFFENEVAKTGQYRDHDIEEVLERVFVMFYTKASRGRPPNSEGKPIYICESRYSEDKKHFNRIKTWKSCIPDEVRNDPDDTIYWDKQIPLKKFPSPLKDTLDPNYKEGDPLPDAKWGHLSAPPLRGAVYIGPRRPNDSPSPEPTPPPRPKSPTPPPTQAQASSSNARPTPTRRSIVSQPSSQSVPQTPVQHRPMQQMSNQQQYGHQGHQYQQPSQQGYYQPQSSMQPVFQQNQTGYQQVQSMDHNQQTSSVQQSDRPDRPDLPMEPVTFKIDGPWGKEALARLQLSEDGIPLFTTTIPQVPPRPKPFFDPQFPTRTGYPARDEKWRTINLAALRTIVAYQYGIPFDEDQKRAWPEAIRILDAFIEKEREAGSTEMENRTIHKAIIYPLEQAFEPIFEEKLARGEAITTKAYPGAEVAKYHKAKRAREASGESMMDPDAVRLKLWHEDSKV